MNNDVISNGMNIVENSKGVEISIIDDENEKANDSKEGEEMEIVQENEDQESQTVDLDIEDEINVESECVYSLDESKVIKLDGGSERNENEEKSQLFENEIEIVQTIDEVEEMENELKKEKQEKVESDFIQTFEEFDEMVENPNSNKEGNVINEKKEELLEEGEKNEEFERIEDKEIDDLTKVEDDLETGYDDGIEFYSGGSGGSNNIDRFDEYGTFFYKLRNGSLPLEYDVSKAIEKINKSIRKNNSDLVCGIISAIAAEYINTIIDKNEYSIIIFLVLLVLIFICLKILTFFIRLIKRISGMIYDLIKQMDGRETQDLFFRKILVQTTYVCSVVKRIQELKDREKSTKVDNNPESNFTTKKNLKEIYSMQGIYGIRKITVELSRIISGPRLLKIHFVKVIGKDNLNKVLEILEDAIKIIKNCNRINDGDSNNKGVDESDDKEKVNRKDKSICGRCSAEIVRINTLKKKMKRFT